MGKREIIERALRLEINSELRCRFFKELRDYLRANMPKINEGARPWECGGNHYDDSPYIRHRHFINFCKIRGAEWLFAHEIFCSMYGPIHCDCGYLYNPNIIDDEAVAFLERKAHIYVNTLNV